MAHKTIAFTAGECGGYHKQFASGEEGEGAYVCQLTVAAPAFELRGGGPPPAVAAAGVAAVTTARSSSAKTGAPAVPAAPGSPVPFPVPVPAADTAAADAAAKVKADRIADVKAFQASPAGKAFIAAKAAMKQNAPGKEQRSVQDVQVQEAKQEVPHQPSRTLPSGEPDPHAMPTGTPPENTPNNLEKQRDIDLENEFAQHAAKAGYRVEQGPDVPGTTNPDYRIEGQIFDCYAPNSTNLNYVRKMMAGKVNKEQARRLGINLDNAPHLTVDDIRTIAHQMQAGTGKPKLDAPKLEEVLVWKNGQFHHVFP